MSKLTKVFMIVICITLVLGIFAGCGGNDADETETTTKETTTKETTKKQTETEKKGIAFPYTGEKVIFSGFTADLKIVEDPEAIVTKEFYKRVGNVDIEWEAVPYADFKQKAILFLNSGDIPDIMWARDVITKINTYASTGILIDWNEYLDYMPNFSKLVEENDWLSFILDDQNRRYALYEFYPTDYTILSWFYNNDKLKEYNVEVPETADDLLAVLRSIKSQNPDMYPFVGNMTTVLRALMDMHSSYTAESRSYNPYYNAETGKWEYKMTEPDGEYKKVLQLANTMFVEGLLHPEITTMSNEQINAWIESGEWAIMEAFDKSFEGTVFKGKEVPFEIEPMHVPTIDGKAYMPVTIAKDGLPFFGIFGSADVENPELLAAYMDLLLSDEMSELLYWGLEGTTFKKNADGTREYLPNVKLPTNESGTDDPASFGIRSMMDLRFLNSRDFYAETLLTFGPLAMKAYNLVLDAYESGRHESSWMQPQPLLSAEEKDEISAIISPVKTYIKENEVKFVLGQRSFDEWNDFVDEINNMGDIEKLLEIYNSKDQYELGERKYK